MVKNIIRSQENSSAEIALLTEEAVESVKQIEIECGLSSWTVEDYKSEILRKDSIALISKKQDLVVGFLIARLITTEPTTPISVERQAAPIHILNQAEIFNIGVRSNFQKKGIGQSLLASFLSNAKNYHVSNIWLEVRESNHPAINFYLRNGFIKIGSRKKFYHSPVENGVIMNLNLSITE